MVWLLLLNRTPALMISILLLAFVNQCYSSCFGTIPEYQYRILEDFYYSTGGPNWHLSSANTPWVFPSSLWQACTEPWVGIACTQLATNSCVVASISLGQKNLVGFLPQSLGNMTSLINIDVHSNSLTGYLPATLGNLSILQEISAYANFLSGPIPVSLCSIHTMAYFYLYSNMFSGSICTSIGEMNALIVLDLRSNPLTGYVPTSMGNLQLLKDIFLYSSSLSGPIPSSLGQIGPLKILNFVANYLSKTIPSSLGQFTNLKELFLYSNLLTGPIPSSLGALLTLQVLYLEDNSLTQSIPSSLGSLSCLRVFDARSNFLRGPIPSSLGAMTALEQLFLFSNSLTSSIPSTFGDFPVLQIMDLDSNLLQGEIPSSLGRVQSLEYVFLFNNHLTGTLPSTLGNISSLTYFSIANNYFWGTIPASLGNLSVLEELFFNSNDLTGPIPSSLGSMSSLIELFLYSNYLSGPLPQSLSSLSQLSGFWISGNCLTGSIDLPFPINNNISLFNISNNYFQDDISFLSFLSPNLEMLDLSKNKFHGVIDDIARFSNLRVLSLSENCFSGSITTSVCDLHYLKSLVLDNLGAGELCSKTWGRFISSTNKMHGWFPQCVLSLPSLVTLHMIGNNMYGSLVELPSTSPLLNIALMSNYLTGSIPSSFLHRNLSQLFLSFNRLSGTLDAGMNLGSSSKYVNHSRGINFTSSTYVNVSSNRLSGNIPLYLSHLSSYDAVEGNIFSCLTNYQNDVNALTYPCGSLVLTEVFRLYVAFIILCIIVIACVGIRWDVAAHYWQNIEEELFERNCVFISIYRKSFLVIALIAFAVMILFCLGVLSTSLYSTHYFQYGWSLTLCNKHGIVPALFVMLIAILSCCYFYVVLISPLLVSRAREDTIRLRSLSNGLEKSEFEDSSAPMTYKDHMLLYSFIIVNVIILFIGNGFYVLFVLISSDTFLQFVFSFILGAFKSFLTLFGSYVIYNRFVDLSIVHKVSCELVLGLFSFLICPLLVMFFTSVNCFYYSLVGIPSVSFHYLTESVSCSSIFLYLSGNVDASCTNVITSVGTSITPPWVYSFQCGSNLIMDYTPVIMYSFIFSSVLLPFIQYCLLIHTSWEKRRDIIRMYPFILPIVYFSFSHVDLLDLPSESVLVHRNTIQASRHVVRVMRHVVILLTFGIAFPYLSMVVIFSIGMEIVMYRIQLGVLVDNLIRAYGSCMVTSDRSDSKLSQMIESIIRINKNQVLSTLITYLPIYMTAVLLFWGIFVLDMIGDVYGMTSGISALVAFEILAISIVWLVHYQYGLRKISSCNSAAATAAAASSISQSSIELSESKNRQ